MLRGWVLQYSQIQPSAASAESPRNAIRIASTSGDLFASPRRRPVFEQGFRESDTENRRG